MYKVHESWAGPYVLGSTACVTGLSDYINLYILQYETVIPIMYIAPVTSYPIMKLSARGVTSCPA